MKKIERILKHLEDQGIAPSSFERKVGLSNSYFNNTMKRGEDITAKMLDRIRDNAPETYFEIFPNEKPQPNAAKEITPPSQKHPSASTNELDRLKAENELLRFTIRNSEKLDKLLEVMQPLSVEMKDANQRLRVIEQQQIVTAAIDTQYQQYLVGKLDVKADPVVTVEGLQRRAFEVLTSIRLEDNKTMQGTQHSMAT